MKQKFKGICLGFAASIILLFAASGAVFAQEEVLAEYPLFTDDMSIELPDGWYLNTPKSIDSEFLKVSDNSAIKLKKYLSKQYVAYNLVSKDLNSEINVIVLHNTSTKLVFDYATIDQDKLISQLENLMESGTNDDAGQISYTGYEMVSAGDPSLPFSAVYGKIAEEDRESDIIQYSTIVNGYGINLSIKSYGGANAERDKELIERIVDSIKVNEIREGNRKKQMFIEFLPPALMLLAFIGFTAYILIKQVRKNRS